MPPLQHVCVMWLILNKMTQLGMYVNVNVLQEVLFEEKNRLGSIPPTCHNKCNQCHPCMAVQVPSFSHNSHKHVLQPASLITPTAPKEGFFLQGNNNRYSNYKPLSWKCHCGGHFFNP